MGYKSESSVFGCIAFVVIIGGIVSPVVAGIGTGNIWVGVLVFLGTGFSFFALITTTALYPFIYTFIASIMGVALLYGAGSLGGWHDVWLWSLFFLPAILALILTSTSMVSRKSKKFRPVVLILVLLVLLMPFGRDYYPSYVDAEKERTSTTITEFLTDLYDPIWEATPLSEQTFEETANVPYNASPLLGFLYYALIMINLHFIFKVWIKFWNLAIFSPLFIITITLGIYMYRENPIWVHLLTFGPPAWIYMLLDHSELNWGGAGWGIVLLGLAFTLVFLPHRRLIQIQNTSERLNPRSQGLPMNIVSRLMGVDYHGREVEKWSNTLLMVNKLAFTAMIWVALSRLQAEPLNFFFIPDLATAQWPLPQFPYIIFGSILGFVTFLFIVMEEKYYYITMKHKMDPFYFRDIIYCLLGSIVLTVFIPAGALLFFLSDRFGRLFSSAVVMMSEVQPVSRRR